MERTGGEVEADRLALSKRSPLAEDITLDMLSEHEARLCMLELTAAT